MTAVLTDLDLIEVEEVEDLVSAKTISATTSDPAVRVAGSPPLPAPRGPLSEWLLARLPRDPLALGCETQQALPRTSSSSDTLHDEDLQLTLHVIHELSYRGFDGVDDRWEWDLGVLALRRQLESAFEADLRRLVDDSRLIDGARSVAEVIGRFAGPSLSTHMAREGTRDQFEEFCIQRSGYQLKEADPHSWVLPRISGDRKAALVEIQADEYGNGRPGHSHAEIFAGVLDSLGLDSAYGAYLDRLPAVTLATGNLISMLGTQRRLRAALLGHLAGFEMTSVVPMTRYRAAVDRLGLGDRVARFYDVHIEADERHGALAAAQLVGGDPESEGLAVSEICFGAAALILVEDRFARSLLRAWSRDESSLRPT